VGHHHCCCCCCCFSWLMSWWRPLRLEERVNGILLRLEKELDQAEKDTR